MIWQMIEDWFRGILTDGILSNLSGLFDSVNTEVGEIATQVGTTPAGWNAGIFNMIRSLSENVIVPIAGVIITFVMCYELIQIVIEKNNLHDLDTWIFFKWIFKTFVAVLLVTNLCCGAAGNKHLEHRHGSFRRYAERRQSERGGYHIRYKHRRYHRHYRH